MSERLRLIDDLRARWLARLAPRASQDLDHRNVYILPTRAGLALAVTLLALLAGSVNYQLSLGYLLTFLLAGCAGAALLETHATLRGLRVALLPPEPGWAGRPLPLAVRVDAPAGRRRPAVRLAIAGPRGTRDAGQEVIVDIAPDASCTVTLTCLPARRGLLPVPPVRIETVYPLGLFRAWTVWRPAGQLMVAPAPEPAAPRLAQAVRHRPASPDRPRRGGGPGLDMHLADALRRWRRGDGLNLVAWKRSAQRDQLVSREPSAEARHDLWLELAATGLADHEAALSRLAAWVLEAEATGMPWGLRVPGRMLPPAQGASHRRQAMEALARC